MSLISCPECGKQISTSAGICPHCGYPLKTLVHSTIAGEHTKAVPKKRLWQSVLMVIAFLAVLLTIISLINQSTKDSPSVDSDTFDPMVVTTPGVSENNLESSANNSTDKLYSDGHFLFNISEFTKIMQLKIGLLNPDMLVSLGHSPSGDYEVCGIYTLGYSTLSKVYGYDVLGSVTDGYNIHSLQCSIPVDDSKIMVSILVSIPLVCDSSLTYDDALSMMGELVDNLDASGESYVKNNGLKYSISPNPINSNAIMFEVTVD